MPYVNIGRGRVWQDEEPTPQAPTPAVVDPGQGPFGGSSPAAPTPSIDSYISQLEAEARKQGATPEAGWRDDLSRAYQGGDNAARSTEDIFKSIFENQAKRGASTNARTVDSQSSEGNDLYGSGTGNPSNTPGGPFGQPQQSDAMRSVLSALSSMPALQTQPGRGGIDPARGDVYRQAYEQIQNAAYKELGRYFDPKDVDVHLRNMGYRFDEDKRIPMPNVQNWTTNILPTEPEAVAYRQRGAQPTTPSTPSPASNTTLTPTAAPSSPFPTRPAPMFSDPAQQFVEDTAMTRYEQRTNPPQGSGTQLYESFAKEFASLLQGDVFSDAEEAALKTKAFDQLEQNKQSEMRQKAEELARRRISQQSGVYISEMNRIRDKWDKHKAAAQNDLTTQAIGERQRRLTQSLSVLASLSASEEGRLDAAMALAMIPLQLQQQAFQNNVTAAGLGGDLSGVTQGLYQLLSMANDNARYDDATRAGAYAGIGEWLGSLFG